VLYKNDPIVLLLFTITSHDPMNNWHPGVTDGAQCPYRHPAEGAVCGECGAGHMSGCDGGEGEGGADNCPQTRREVSRPATGSTQGRACCCLL